MLDKIEKGEAKGIIAWHPDRLARNSVDGGKIIFLIDNEKINFLKFPTFWFEATPQGKFMLNIAFGQSKYFVDNLSENTKRGLRQKLRRGEMPGYAPLGYLNDKLKHTIIKDPDRFRLIKKIFELYATGNFSLKSLQNKMTSLGLFSRKEKQLTTSMIHMILKKPFYYGAFKYNNELHQGKHEPMITKKLFDKCQEVSANRARPQIRNVKEFAFRGLFECGECGCSITSETQKGHNYYRCTKKRVKCSQSYVREEELDKQITTELQKVSLPKSWADKMIEMLNNDKEKENEEDKSFVQNLKIQIKKHEIKLDNLLDSRLEEVISKDEYTSKKQKILNHKIELEDNLRDFEHKGNHWLEPAIKFILDAKQAGIIALQENLSKKRDFLKKIGSNRILRERELFIELNSVWQIIIKWGLSAQRALACPRESGEKNLKNTNHTDWLGDRESNPDCEYQKLASYR